MMWARVFRSSWRGQFAPQVGSSVGPGFMEGTVYKRSVRWILEALTIESKFGTLVVKRELCLLRTTAVHHFAGCQLKTGKEIRCVCAVPAIRES